jgi:hypothetical protein
MLRDVLTVLAALVICVLVAALAVPPLIDWSAHRTVIEAALARAGGAEVKTSGPIEVRLLPTPRLTVERLQFGSGSATDPSLDAASLRAEIALTPLLHGEVRFLETRIGRAEIRVPIGPEGDWRFPHALLAPPVLEKRWAFEDLEIGQLLLTAVVPNTGRTDQVVAESVRIQSQGLSLAGPWRVEGRLANVPFQLATSEVAAGTSVLLKLTGGGDQHPRFDVDGRLDFAAGPEETLVPTLAGAAKVLLGPPGQIASGALPIPVSLQAEFKAAGQAVSLDGVAIEAGTGGASLRLGGSGLIDGEAPRFALSLEGRRLDLDSFILSDSGRALADQAGTWTFPALPMPIQVSIKLDSIGLAQDELTNAVLRATVVDGTAHVEQAEVTAPGPTRLLAEGDVLVQRQWTANGRLALSTPASDRLARYLGKLGVAARYVVALDGRPFDASAEISLGSPVASFRKLRLQLGAALLTGAGRYTAPEPGARGKLEAQVALQGLDLNAIPPLGSVFETAQALDVGLILDARDIAYGPGTAGGRIAARVAVAEDTLLVERLEVVDLAGASADISGRVGADGSGRIQGRVAATRAAPLLDLLGRAWLGGLSSLAPPFLREGAVDLALLAERAGDAASAGPTLKTTLKGKAGSGRLEAEIVTGAGAVQTLTALLDTERAGAWLGRDMPSLRAPARITLRGSRDGTGALLLSGSADLPGLTLRTTAPFAFGVGDESAASAEAEIEATDLASWAALLGEGAALAEGPLPGRARVTLGREKGGLAIGASGRLGSEPFELSLKGQPVAGFSGSASVGRASLPWLISALVLKASPGAAPGSPWPTARFGDFRPDFIFGPVHLRAARMDLGRGITAEDASLSLTLTPEGLSIEDAEFAVAGGRIRGRMAVNRQGAMASLAGEGEWRNLALRSLAGTAGIEARLSGSLRLGGAGGSVSALVANLGGAGSLALDDIAIEAADPAAIGRALARSLSDSDPLGPGRVEAIVSGELARGPFRGAAPPAPATMVGGVMRVSPLVAESDSAVWQGAALVDFRNASLDLRGTLGARAAPPGWTGAPPYILLNWRGPLAKPAREFDVAPLTNGLATIVLQRELDRMETFEADINERKRLNARLEMDKARRAAEEAARQQALRDEAERQARAAAERAAASPSLPELPQPLEIRPAPQIRPQPPGG